MTETTLKSNLVLNSRHFNSVMWHPESPSDRERKRERLPSSQRQRSLYGAFWDVPDKFSQLLAQGYLTIWWLSHHTSQALEAKWLEKLLVAWPPGSVPGGTSGKEPACQCRRHKRCRFDPWVWKIPWRRKWQPTPVCLPGESHWWRSLVNYSPWDSKESVTSVAT